MLPGGKENDRPCKEEKREEQGQSRRRFLFLV
jgi:hypothetical protein